MAKLDILEYPDSRLRKIARAVTQFDHKLHILIDNMLETMYDAPGIGLAATQVNIHQCVVVIDISEEKNHPLILVNPSVKVLPGEPHEMQEGCLSVPGYYEEVTRIDHVLLSAQDKFGQAFTLEAEDLLAVCIQHELDHLKGKLFVDYLSPLKRNRIKKKLVKLHKMQT